MCNLPPRSWMGDFKKLQFTQGCSCKHKSRSICTTQAFSYNKQTFGFCILTLWTPWRHTKSQERHCKIVIAPIVAATWTDFKHLFNLSWNYLTTHCIFKKHSWRWAISFPWCPRSHSRALSYFQKPPWTFGRASRQAEAGKSRTGAPRARGTRGLWTGLFHSFVSLWAFSVSELFDRWTS